MMCCIIDEKIYITTQLAAFWLKHEIPRSARKYYETEANVVIKNTTNIEIINSHRNLFLVLMRKIFDKDYDA